MAKKIDSDGFFINSQGIKEYHCGNKELNIEQWVKQDMEIEAAKHLADKFMERLITPQDVDAYLQARVTKIKNTYVFFSETPAETEKILNCLLNYDKIKKMADPEHSGYNSVDKVWFDDIKQNTMNPIKILHDVDKDVHYQPRQLNAIKEMAFRFAAMVLQAYTNDKETPDEAYGLTIEQSDKYVTKMAPGRDEQYDATTNATE